MKTATGTDRQRLKRLLKTLALEKGHFVLASGRTSSFYLDCRKVTLDAEGSLLVGRMLFQILRAGPKVKGVGGMTMGADPIVSSIVLISQMRRFPLHGFLVRKEKKEHGTQRWIEAAARLKRGSAVAIVEDVVTSGGSLLKAVDRAREEGLEVARTLAIIDREEGGRRAIEEAGLPFECLFQIGELLG